MLFSNSNAFNLLLKMSCDRFHLEVANGPDGTRHGMGTAHVRIVQYGTSMFR